MSEYYKHPMLLLQISVKKWTLLTIQNTLTIPPKFPTGHHNKCRLSKLVAINWFDCAVGWLTTTVTLDADADDWTGGAP
jgi:hypothetical protein